MTRRPSRSAQEVFLAVIVDESPRPLQDNLLNVEGEVRNYNRLQMLLFLVQQHSEGWQTWEFDITTLGPATREFYEVLGDLLEYGVVESTPVELKSGEYVYEVTPGSDFNIVFGTTDYSRLRQTAQQVFRDYPHHDTRELFKQICTAFPHEMAPNA